MEYMKFEELKEFWLHQADVHDACKEESLRLKRARSEKGIAQVWRDNWGWCFEKGLTTDEIIKCFDPEVLLEVDFLTQDNNPIDFTPQEIGGVIWEPFNVGASLENPIGEYLTFDQANDPARGLKVPTNQKHIDLADSGHLWGQYQGMAGRVLNKRLFIPAGGYRHRGTGVLTRVGNGGYSWASSVYTDYRAYHLNFLQGGLNPSSVYYRAYGFQVRCLREE